MKRVTFLYEVGNLSTDRVEIEGCVFPRFEPVIIPDGVYKSAVAMAWRYKFEVCEALVTDGGDVPEYSDHLYTGNITAVIPHYKTTHLTWQAVASLKAAYPDLALIVVDDGSKDRSTGLVRSLPSRFSNTHVMILKENIGHGAVLDAGMSRVKTDLVLTLDTDIIVHRPGFLELMETRLREQELYAIGMLYKRDLSHSLHYLTCVFALYDLEVYRTLPPFEHSGDPMLVNMEKAHKRGLKVECFPVYDYVTHLEAGTRGFVSPNNPGRWDFTGGEV